MNIPVNEQETTISFMRNSDKAIVYNLCGRENPRF